MLTKLREEIGKCRVFADELHLALDSTLHSSKDHNKEINDARARMKQCLADMKASTLPPRKERVTREERNTGA